MKKWLALGVLGIAALSAFAGTCVVTNTRLTTIGNNKVFAGQLKNETGANFLQHNFLVAFIDSNNNLVETKSVEGCLRSLQTNQTNYFSATSTSNASGINAALSRLALDGTLKAGETADGDLTFSNLRIRRQGNQVKVSGTLKNNDNDELFLPRVCVVVKDVNDNVLIVAKTSNLGNLSDNEAVDFNLTLTALDDANAVDNVSVFADGLEGGTGGTPISPEADENNTVTICGTPTNTPTHTPTGTATNTPEPTITPTATNSPTAPTSTPTPCF